MKIEQAKLDELKVAHGELFLTGRRGNDYIFRYPKRGEWKIFRQQVSDNKSTAVEKLVTDCLVFPTLTEMWSYADKDIAMVDLIGSKFIGSIMEDQDETEGKRI